MVGIQLTVLVKRLDESFDVPRKQLRQVVVRLLIKFLAELVPNVEGDLGDLEVEVADAHVEAVEGFDGVVRRFRRAAVDHTMKKGFSNDGEDAAEHHRLVGVLVSDGFLVRALQLHDAHEDVLLQLRRSFLQVNRLQHGADAVGSDVQLFLAGAGGVHEDLKRVGEDDGAGRVGQHDAVHLDPRREAVDDVELDALHERAVVVHQAVLQEVQDHRRAHLQLLQHLLASVVAQSQVARVDLLGDECQREEQRLDGIGARPELLQQAVDGLLPRGHQQDQIGQRQAELPRNDRTRVHRDVFNVHDDGIAERNVRRLGQLVERVLDLASHRLSRKVARVDVAFLLQKLVADFPRINLK